MRQTYHGDFMGAPYEGRGYMGYNHLARCYESIWMGSTGTSLSFSSGSCAADGRTFTMHATEPNPLSGEAADVVDMIEIHDADSHTFTRYYVVPGGDDVKSFEIACQRKD